MDEILLLTLALWIVTHTVALEIPVTAQAPKPFSCQLCLAGWTCVVVGLTLTAYHLDPWLLITVLAIWALTVLVEAVYQKLRTLVL